MKCFFYVDNRFRLKTERKNAMRREMIKKVGKKLGIAMVAAGMVMLTQNVQTEAATHAPGCHARSTIIYCSGDMLPRTGFSHTYYSGERGMVFCTVDEYRGPHEIRCANCMVFLSTEDRICYRIHRDCGSVTETGLCKY